MTTHPGTAAESADSNKCICCKRSKSGGSFFEVKILYDHGYGYWSADIDVFREASRQGCQRCAFAFDIVTTWMEANPGGDERHITVQNRSPLHSMVADVSVYFSEFPVSYEYGQKIIALELLSANHRNPIGLVETVRNRWNIVTKPMSYEDPTSDDELQGCLDYLRQCRDCHSYCINTPHKLPKRVLELSSTVITLQDTASFSSTEPYACLSHCWGPKGPSLQLTKATETRLRQGVHIHLLPRTFSETAKVCMKLGIRFLWIDALCIIQGDKTDWEEAAATMAGIYENALVTIAATCAANSDDGLRPLRDRFKALRLGSSNFFVRECISDYSRIHHSGSDSLWPLMTRAWAFQESKLAPRTLRFSCHGVVWDCRTIKAEYWQSRRDLDDITIDLLPFFSQVWPASDPVRAWHNTIGQYSSLDLTYRTDTLPAIAALAQRMARLRRNDTYFAGMWRSTLLSDIQWQLFSPYLSSHQDSGLPTWSWATTRGAHYNAELHTLPGVEILSLDYTPVGPAEIGAIKDAILTIRGPTFPLPVQASDSKRGFKFSISQQAAFGSNRELWFGPDHDSSPGLYVDGSQSFLALVINSDEADFQGLVFRQVGTVYERVGWFSLRIAKEVVEPLMEHFAQLPLTTVRII